MITNIKNKAIVLALEKGYKIDENGDILNPSNKLIKGYIKETGYKCITIRIDGKFANIGVHRLQAFQKYGEIIFNKNIVVRHLDGNKLNNSIENIHIGSQSDNMMDIPKEIRIKNSSHPIHNHNSIVNDRKSGMTYKELMNKYNIKSKGTISYIINKSLKSLEEIK